MMEILIVEDEPLAVQKLIKLLKQIDQTTTIAGVTDGIESTVEWLHAHPTPDLILMDIELSDGQSFEIFKLAPIECPVIFTTSYDEHAIESFRINSLDYLLKPIKKDELEGALNKFRHFTARQITPLDIGYLVDDLRKKTQQPEFRSQILVKADHRLVTVDAWDIAYFCTKDGVTHLHARDQTTYAVDYTLEALEDLLEPEQFFRANSHFIVAAKAVSQIHPYLNGTLKIDLKPDAEQEVLISRDRIKRFRQWLGR